MITNVKSMFSEIKVNQVRSTLAPYWKSLLLISLVLIGLTLFLGAEYGLANLINQGNYLTGIIILVAVIVLFVTIAYPFWGYAIWFVLSCYLTLFSSILPAMFSFDLIMLSLLTIVLILKAIAKKECRCKLAVEEVFLVLYFIYAYMIRRQFDSGHIVAEMKYLFVTPLFFYFVTKNVISKKKYIYCLILLIIATGFSWALMGIYEQITQKMWLSSIVGSDVQLYAGMRSVGPAGNYYVYGNMLILTVLLCLYVLRWMQKLYSKLIIVAICLVTMIGLYYGYSRAPYVAFFLAMAIMAFFAKYTKKLYAAGVVMIVLAALIVLPHVISNNILVHRFSSPIDARLATNITSENMFKANYLFGVGTDNYRNSVPNYVHRGHTVYASKISGIKNDYSHAHSEYFLKLCELGIVGAVLYFGMYALFLLRFIKLRSVLPKKDIAGYDLACLAFAFMIGVHFTMITDQVDPFLYAIIFAVFALLKKAEFFAINADATNRNSTA